MRITYTAVTAVVGRGLLAGRSLGCLSLESARTRTLSPTTPHRAADDAATSATSGFATVLGMLANSVKRPGTHPPRDVAALL